MSKYYIVVRPSYLLNYVYVRKRLFLGMYRTCGRFDFVMDIEQAWAQAEQLKKRLEATNDPK